MSFSKVLVPLSNATLQSIKYVSRAARLKPVKGVVQSDAYHGVSSVIKANETKIFLGSGGLEYGT